MKQSPKIASILRFFCFRRKYFGVFLLLFINHFFYAQVFKTEDAYIKVESGALLYVAPIENSQPKETPKIYVVGNIIVKNISEQTNAKIVYIEKKNEASYRYAKGQEKKSVEKSKKKIPIVASKAKSFFTSCPANSAFTSFGKNDSRAATSVQNFPTAKAILIENKSIKIDQKIKENLTSLCESQQTISFNSNFSIRPPPVFPLISSFNPSSALFNSLFF